jgi:sulfonate transport system substrate-binding protein
MTRLGAAGPICLRARIEMLTLLIRFLNLSMPNKVLGPLVLACSALAPGHVLGAELPKAVRIAAITYTNAGRTTYYGASAIIEAEGWLKSELKKKGVELEWFPASHAAVGPLVNEAFANHSIDFAGYGDLPSILLNAGGVETQLLLSSGAGNESYLVVPAHSPATSIAELKGKRIAIHRGRPWELTFLKLLEANGLSYNDFKIFNINPVAGAAALAAGKVDALFTLTDAYTLEDQGTGKIIWSTKTAPPEWKMRVGLWGAKSFVDRYPELAQLVVTAHIRAAYWSSQPENRDELIRILARSGTPESALKREYDNASIAWKDRWSPLIDESLYRHFRDAVHYALEKRLISRGIDADRLLEPKFVATALPNHERESRSIAMMLVRAALFRKAALPPNVREES